MGKPIGRNERERISQHFRSSLLTSGLPVAPKLHAKADQLLHCVKIGNATHANPIRASRRGIKKTAWSKSCGSPKTKITNASAVTLRTNAKSAVYGRVRSTIPSTSKTKKRSAARGKPHTT